jgi:DnaK suppressor protein
MRYLTIEQRELLRDSLSSRAARLRSDIGNMLRCSRRPACGSLARRMEEALDTDVETLEAVAAEIDNPQARQEVRHLQIVSEALARLRSPDYGLCADCGGDIPFVFLKDEPLTTLCRQCRQRRELAPFVPNET